jgi:hypothetical protein
VSAPAVTPGRSTERDEVILAELRARRNLAFDEPRVLGRLDELLQAHDADPSPHTVEALRRAAYHLRITPHRALYTTVVRTLLATTGKPATWLCPRCDRWVISELAGHVTCGPCATPMERVTSAEAGAR